ncbi:hypothetical protein NQ317_000036 [Molorchus minor]|uniref:Uncharacterized protein n=1 Tax=Molorchus minor TaxID=1323400 RepID=A0ABQ9IV29_9CUCU|nr:hypothetical protein NQ317_000036 [Molorchus minor]
MANSYTKVITLGKIQRKKAFYKNYFYSCFYVPNYYYSFNNSIVTVCVEGGIILPLIIITAMPQNSSDKSKETILPSIFFTLCHITSIVLNIVLLSTIIRDIWQGIVFWSLAEVGG